MGTSFLDKALNQSEVTEKHIPATKLKTKVARLQATIAQMDMISEFLRDELDGLLKGEPIIKKESKKEAAQRKVEEFLNKHKIR